MSASDLTTVEQVQTWAGSLVTNTSQVQALISSASDQILASLGRRSILPFAYTDVYDGECGSEMFLREWPVTAVSSVVIDGVAIFAASANVAGVPPSYGWLLAPPDPFPPGRMQSVVLRGQRFSRGRQNVTVAYTAGYQTTETWTVPSPAPYQINVRQPLGAWAADVGVAYVGGATFTALPTPSMLAAGQYTIASGQFTFSSADVGRSIAITYGFIPQALAQACAQWVAELVSYSGRVGLRSKTLGGQETITYDTSAVPARVAMMLEPYKRRIMI